MAATIVERPNGSAGDGPGPRQASLLSVAGPGVAVLSILALPGIFGRDMWLDEAYTMAAVRSPGPALRLGHGTMALYYALVAPWAQVSMAGWWVRLLSLLLMAAAVVVFALMLRRQWGPSIARWAAVFVASSFLVVHLAGEARAYALVALLVVVAWSALDRAVADPADHRSWRTYWACCALVPLAQGVATVQVGAMFLSVLVAGGNRRTVRRALAGLGAAAAVFGALVLSGINSVGGWVSPMRWAHVVTLIESLTSPYPAAAAILAVAVLAAAGRCTCQAVAAVDVADRFRSAMYLCWGLATVAAVIGVSILRPIYVPRYTAASSFGLAALLAIGFRLRPGSTRLPLMSIALIGVLLTAGMAGGAASVPTWSAAVAQVSAGTAPGDVFLFPNRDTRLPFETAWVDRGLATGAPIVGDRHGLGSLARPEGDASLGRLLQLASEATVNKGRVWVISQPMAGSADRYDDFLADATVRGRFRVRDHWRFADGIDVALLDRR